MIKVIPHWAEKTGTIRARIIDTELDGRAAIIKDCTMLEVLQLKEGLEAWLASVHRGEIQNR